MREFGFPFRIPRFLPSFPPKKITSSQNRDASSSRNPPNAPLAPRSRYLAMLCFPRLSDFYVCYGAMEARETEKPKRNRRIRSPFQATPCFFCGFGLVFFWFSFWLSFWLSFWFSFWFSFWCSFQVKEVASYWRKGQRKNPESFRAWRFCIASSESGYGVNMIKVRIQFFMQLL